MSQRASSGWAKTEESVIDRVWPAQTQAPESHASARSRNYDNGILSTWA